MHLEQYGNCRLGDQTVAVPSQKSSFVMRACGFNGQKPEATAGDGCE